MIEISELGLTDSLVISGCEMRIEDDGENWPDDPVVSGGDGIEVALA
jgi:hypothetical protein